MGVCSRVGGGTSSGRHARPTTRESDSHVLPPQRTAAAGRASGVFARRSGGVAPGNRCSVCYHRTCIPWHTETSHTCKLLQTAARVSVLNTLSANSWLAARAATRGSPMSKDPGDHCSRLESKLDDLLGAVEAFGRRSSVRLTEVSASATRLAEVSLSASATRLTEVSASATRLTEVSASVAGARSAIKVSTPASSALPLRVQNAGAPTCAGQPLASLTAPSTFAKPNFNPFYHGPDSTGAGSPWSPPT